MKRQILAMGGGGFSMEPENLLLDAFFLSLAKIPNPKICFVGTASGDAQGYIDNFYANMKKHECQPSHLSLFKPPQGNLREFVLEKDIIYVGGGNTRNLMVLWKEWRLDTILKEAYQNGVVLGGVSAGSICWFEQGVTDSVTGTLSALNCIGILQGSNCPHYDGEAERRPNYHRLINEGMKPGIACDDGVAAHFIDEKLVGYVSSRPTAAAYQVGGVATGVEEKKIKPRYL